MSKKYVSLGQWASTPLSPEGAERMNFYTQMISELNEYAQANTGKVVETVIPSPLIPRLTISIELLSLKRVTPCHAKVTLNADGLEFLMDAKIVWDGSKFKGIDLIIHGGEEDLKTLKQIDDTHPTSKDAFFKGRKTTYAGGAISCAVHRALHKYLEGTKLVNFIKKSRVSRKWTTKTNFRME